MLDVESLRLTGEELRHWIKDRLGEHNARNLDFPARALADAATAKALWGVQEWLNRFEQGPACCQPHSLEDMILAAGIPRPQDSTEAEGCEFCHKKVSAHCELCDGRFCLDHFAQHSSKCLEHGHRN